MKVAVGSSTHPGQVRDNNEDSFLVDERLALFAVADGLGGHQAGEIASRDALEAMRAAVAGGAPLNEAILAANRSVYERAAADESLRGMATTVTAVVPAGGAAVLIGQVGDSRAYLLRDGELHRLTEDHSLVEELVREGRITPEQAAVHPQRAIITRALGLDPNVEVDLSTTDVRAGDRLVLCSDGLTTMVREREIEQVARSETDPLRAAERLVDRANEAGGEDNITVVVLDVLEVDASVPPDPELLALTAPRSTPTPVPAPEPPAETQAATRPGRAPGRRGRRVRNIALGVVPVVLVIALAFATLAWYARRTYYVGLTGDDVALYRGVPGGFLWWDATVERRSDLTVDDLTDAERGQLDGGAAEGSRERAAEYLERLERRVDERTTTTTTTRPRSTSTTSTTRPRATTTTTTTPRSATTTP